MPTYRLSPADLARLPADTRRVVAQALADHIGNPVALGDVEAQPPAAEAPLRPSAWPWVRGVGIVVLVVGGVAAGSVAWLMRPQALPVLPGQVAAKHVTPGPTAATPSTTQAAPRQAPASGDPAHATAPAQVLPNPPAPGATICKVVGGVYACGWVQAG